MVRKRFKMFLNLGMAGEYEKRHNKLRPEMKEMIHQCDGHNYSIFLDREADVLYGYLKMEDGEFWTKSANTPINRRQWDYMTGIVETRADNNPVCVDFIPVFHLN